jgi:2-polyprenyl-6-methoxyphenol hydroxylase-like FAD-dependent oxidoreductase
MCAAQALADVFTEVILVERDRYPEGAEVRRGAPQGRMFHNLIERGRREIEALFPGFHALLDEAGTPRSAGGFNVAYMTPRGWGRAMRFPFLRAIFATRTLMEATIRRLLRQTANVRLIEEAEAVRLLAEKRDDRLTCVGAEVRQAGRSEAVYADLVVDASGGQSKAPQWLEQLGLAPPEELILDPCLAYASQWLRMRPQARWPSHWWWTHGVFVQRIPPHDLNSAHLLRHEGDRWLLTLVAGGGADPPMDAAGVEAFLSSLRSPLLAQMLPLFEPETKFVGYRLSKNRWRRYDRWAESLDGFVALGDSACVYNPNLGQGMSVASAEATILRDCTRRSLPASRLSQVFFKAQARFQATPWQLATSNDLRFTYVSGPRSFGVRAFNWYRQQLALARNLRVQRRLSEVDLLLRPVSALYDPSICLLAAISRAISMFGNDDDELFGPFPPVTQ